MSACSKPSGAAAWRRAARDQAGATTLEFGLIGVVLIALLFGCMEFSRYLITVSSVRTATAEAVRLAMLRGGQNLTTNKSACTNMTGALDGATDRAPLLNATSLSVTMSGCTTTDGITTVSIAVSYPFVFNLPLFSVTNKTISGSAQAIFN